MVLVAPVDKPHLHLVFIIDLSYRLTAYFFQGYRWLAYPKPLCRNAC